MCNMIWTAQRNQKGLKTSFKSKKIKIKRNQAKT